jgi:FHA domain
MSSSKLALSFRLFQNGQLIREETLTQSVIKVGKVPSAHLQIADDAVSRMHAIIEVTGRDVSLIDLGSTRGSFVNGKKVNKARLESGDVITLGDTRIELAIRDAAALAAGPRAARPPAVPAPARRSAEPSTVVSGVIEAVPAVAPAHAIPPTAVIAPVTTAPPPASSAPASSAPASSAPASSAPASSAPGLAAPSPPARVIPAPVAAAAEPPGAAGLPVAPPAEPRAQPLAGAAGDPRAASAIEVAAMLGDSVVGVKHCIDPRGGKIAPATWGLVAGGALCLLASAIAFCASVATAADNHDRLDAWTRVEHRPAYAFRPARLGPAVDWIAFGGFGLAIAGLGLGIARMRRERVSPYYRIGTAPGVELAIEGAPAPAFPLVAPSGDDFVFHFAPGIDGELLQGGSATPLTQLAASGRARPSASTPGAFALAIPRHARIRARAGLATFLIAAVPRPRRHAAPLLAGIESRALVYVAGSLAVHLAIWGILQLVPPEPSSISLEAPVLEPIVVALQGTQHEDPVQPDPEVPGGGGGDTGGPRMALPEGASGDPSVADHGQLRIAGAELPPAMSRDEAIRNARETSFLGRELLASAIRDLAERTDFAQGFDPVSADGSWIGDFGAGGGNFGAGRAGAGAGGGCSGLCGDDLIAGDSRYATISDGPGAGGRYGLPGRGFGTRAHTPQLPTIGTPRVDGSGPDKTIIRRYIRRSIDKIAYCYDSQLLAHPGIEGEILVKFFIAPTGAVERSSGAGFDPEVARCVADVIHAIAFPRSGDGAGVEVNYPFQFHAAGR